MPIENVAIIGAGIVGSFIARELSKYQNLRITIFEKEVDVTSGTSKANTGIIHAGYDDDPKRQPMRAGLCAKGNMLWHVIASQLEIPVNWCGALVGSTKDSEITILGSLYNRGLLNGVPNLKLLAAEEARKLEPNLNGIIAALYATTEGSILPFYATIAVIENAVSNGVLLKLQNEVISIEESKDFFILNTNQGIFEADWIINAAGLYGDKISHMLGIAKTNNGIDIEIHPRRGEYWIFPSEYHCPVNHIIFPVPSQIGKGICILPDTEGNTLIGPTSEDMQKDQKENNATSRDGLEKVYNYIVEKWGPILPPKNKCIKNYAGLRAEPPHEDFIIEGYSKPSRFINVIGIRSPGLTSSPAIAIEVLRIMESQGFIGVKKSHWNPYRKSIPRVLAQTIECRKMLSHNNLKFANLVCWCEGVSEGEIVEAIRRGARTLQGVAFRTRAGLGRCQGMSCQSKIVEILSKELGVPPDKILLKSEGSEVLLCKIKGLFGDLND